MRMSSAVVSIFSMVRFNCHQHCFLIWNQETEEKINSMPPLGENMLTLKAPITTAADNKFCNIFPNFRQKSGMILHENCLPADNSDVISCLICYF